MRKLWAAGIAVALALLWVVPPGVSGAAAGESDQARLERYAAATWASFVAMVDTPSGLPTDQLHADGSTDSQTSTRTSAPTCGARSPPSGSASSGTTSW